MKLRRYLSAVAFSLVACGAPDGNRVHPDQGTDLLAFFGGVVERSLRRWLA